MGPPPSLASLSTTSHSTHRCAWRDCMKTSDRRRSGTPPSAANALMGLYFGVSYYRRPTIGPSPTTFHTVSEGVSLLKNPFAPPSAPSSGAKYSVLVVFSPCFRALLDRRPSRHLLFQHADPF